MAPASIGSTLRSLKYRRIAFFAHSLTTHAPPRGSATRSSPASSRPIASSTGPASSSPAAHSSSIRSARFTACIFTDPSRVSVALRWRAPSKRCVEELDRTAAFLLGRNEREADVALARRSEEGAGRDEDAGLQQSVGERLRFLPSRAGDPEIHRRLAARHPDPIPLECSDDQVALASVRGTCPLDMVLVSP